MTVENQGDWEHLSRPKDQLLKYPVAFRWEVTRRHPYYLALWKDVQEYHRSPNDSDINSQLYRKGAKLLLGSIGVFGEPVAPETPFAEIADDDPSFLCSSLQPVTFRAMVARFFFGLTPKSQMLVGNALQIAALNAQNAVHTKEQREINQLELISILNLEPSAELDSVLQEPVFAMYLGASQETITEDANRQARLWKKKLNCVSPKIHTKKLATYLEVWDAVEGWTGRHYDVSHEMTIQQAAEKFRRRTSTIHQQYQSAFAAVIGRPFTGPNWWKTQGRFKIAEAARMKMISFARMMRRMNEYSPTVQLVPEATLESFNQNGSGSFLDQVSSATSNDDSVSQLVTDILRLIDLGRSDDEILEELELRNPCSRRLVQYIRTKELCF